MKQYKEIIIEFGLTRDIKEIVDEIEEKAYNLYKQGYYYEGVYVDAVLSKIYLLFYKKI